MTDNNDTRRRAEEALRRSAELACRYPGPIGLGTAMLSDYMVAARDDLPEFARIVLALCRWEYEDINLVGCTQEEIRGFFRAALRGEGPDA